jgi:SAM-dependent methyltransferase
MTPNIYENSAALYDMGNDRAYIAADIQFYLTTIAPDDSVLEVGCGTGRVTIPLAERGNTITGIDLSQTMLAEFQSKLAKNTSASRRVTLRQMDMRGFDLGQTFDWIIFPFRVFQALTSDEERLLCLASMQHHMHEESRAVLTLFNPMKAILDSWGRKNILDFERTDERTGRSIRRYQDQLWHDQKRQIIATNLRHEVYENGLLVETLVDTLELGYLYSDQCAPLFTASGLTLVNAFGSYDRQPLRADEQKEQIYILRKGEFEPHPGGNGQLAPQG